MIFQIVMPLFSRLKPRVFLVAAIVFIFTAVSAAAADTKPLSGLIVTLTTGSHRDTLVSPNVWLYTEPGKSPSPFLPDGKFTATWTGTLSVDLRGEFLFGAELNGSLKLEINGQTVLEAASIGETATPSKPIKLNKGANVLKAIFSSPDSGAAFVRLRWSEKGVLWEPLPREALLHMDTPELAEADKLRLGRELVIEHRCLKCHRDATLKTPLPELEMDAPDFEGVGSRRNAEWLFRWIRDPKALRKTAHMPQVFNDGESGNNARAVAAFLASLKSGDPAVEAEPKSDQADAGKALAEKLHCAGCHNLPDDPRSDEARISLKNVLEKFAPGQLEAFLQKPDAHFAWIRMPDFHLTGDEAASLTAYLNSVADKPTAYSISNDSVLIERGKKLVQSSGCLNCHQLKLENQFSGKALAELSWLAGCMAEKPDATSKAPRFNLEAADREAIRAFAATDRTSLGRHVPADFADRESRVLNCRGCHGQLEGFPALELLGGKLRPEWSAQFIAGQVKYKPRPWLEARMPAFSKPAALLATGLAATHGYPPQTPLDAKPNPELVKIGQKLISSDGGFSCISCHAVADQKATQVFESEGINLAYPAGRLLPAYYQRWVRNPPRIDPASKMPVYFDEEGKSPLTEILGGDAGKQIDAIWNYLQLGDKIPPPVQPQ